ncbi:nitroreductase family protein [Natronosalvus vescus]|uniref:nitroreductase family protein n=1 Tax=Natronosalvus vescus TaxID=2953881 RepID=UPI0020902C7A|nr:nitroreductase family protein [Natronosalvus vescus]
MPSLLSRGKSIYNEEGARQLFRKSTRYSLNKFYENVVWKIFPKNKTLRTIARSRVLTSIYFTLKGTFYQEQRAVLCGVAKYHEAEEQRDAPRHRIIRSIHRIEKGLSMRNRRPVFAESYVGNVVGDLKTAWNPEEDDEQLYWAIDVLANYFKTVEHTDAIAEAHEEFSEFLAQIDYTPGNRVPYPRRELSDSPVSYADLKQLATQRTSTRWFQDKEVPRELVDKSLEIAMQSPSACNRQSFEFRLYDEPELIEELSSLAIGARGYKHNIPCLAAIVGKQRAYFDARDKHVIYIDASLAAMAFQFSLETQGLASCCINWPAIPHNERQLNNILELDDDETVVMFMAIGFPDKDGMVPYSEKKNVESIISYNKVSK